MSELVLPSPVRAAYDLESHREYLTHIGLLVSGMRALHEDETAVWIYRLPVSSWMHGVVFPNRTVRTEYGTLIFGERITARDENSGEERDVYVESLANPAQGLDFISDLIHLTLNRKRELAVLANKDLERNGSSQVLRDLLFQYGDLMKQLEHEHYRQRDRYEGK